MCPDDINDSLVAEIANYQRAMAETATDEERHAIASRHPDVHHAARLREEDGPAAWEIEARAIAGESDEKIAEVTGLPIGVVTHYLGAHFDVKDRVDAKGWLFDYGVVDRLDQDGVLTEGDVWRTAAYAGRSATINTVIGDYHHRPDPDPAHRAEQAQLIRGMVIARFVDERSDVDA